MTRTFWWLGVNRTIEDPCLYHVKIFLRTIKIFSPLIISLLEIFIVKWGLVTKLLHWGIIISSEHSRVIIRRQPARKYYLPRSDWGGEWKWCIGKPFSIFLMISRQIMSRVCLNTKIMSQPSCLRQSKWFRHIDIVELVLDCESLDDFENWTKLLSVWFSCHACFTYRQTGCNYIKYCDVVTLPC